MENDIESDINSQNDAIDDVNEIDDINVLKEKYQKISETNRHLFARAKKAEGFIEKDGKWIKPKKVEPKTEEKPEATPKDQDTIDYGQLAYYNSLSEVKVDDEDISFLQETMEETGKSMQSVLKSKFFQNELKERKEEKKAKDATPSSNKRSTTIPTNTVDYWMAKDALPPVEQVELRRKVVNERIKREETGKRFYNS